MRISIQVFAVLLIVSFVNCSLVANIPENKLGISLKNKPASKIKTPVAIGDPADAFLTKPPIAIGDPADAFLTKPPIAIGDPADAFLTKPPIAIGDPADAFISTKPIAIRGPFILKPPVAIGDPASAFSGSKKTTTNIKIAAPIQKTTTPVAKITTTKTTSLVKPIGDSASAFL